jgi:hypothetical protein
MASLTHNMWWSISHVILKAIKCEQLNKLYCISFVRAPTGFTTTHCCVLCGRNTARAPRAYRGRMQPTAMLPDIGRCNYTTIQRCSRWQGTCHFLWFKQSNRRALCYLSRSTEILYLKQISSVRVSVFCSIVSLHNINIDNNNNNN